MFELDVFKIATDGAAIWQFAAPSLQEAHARIRELAAKSPAVFLILDLKTGDKIRVPRATALRSAATLPMDEAQI